VDGKYWLRQFEPAYHPITLRTVLPVLPEQGTPEIVKKFVEIAEKSGLETLEDNDGKYPFIGVALGPDPVGAARLAIQILRDICEIQDNPALHDLKGIVLEYKDDREEGCRQYVVLPDSSYGYWIYR
jgi:hypothetical protein